MNRDGFTLIELVVGMMILVIAVMALAGSTGYVSLQLQAADLRTDRSLAHQHAVERLRGMPYDSLETKVQAEADTIGDYTFWWEVDVLRWAISEVSVMTEGPGFRNGAYTPGVQDTMTIRIARPNP